MSKSINLIGERFGKLLVIKDSGKRTSSRTVEWECVCDCGNTRLVTCDRLKSKTKPLKSCKKCSSNIFTEKQDYAVGVTKSNVEFYFDINDFDRVKKHTWTFDGKYICTYINNIRIRLHRFIINASCDKYVDHINNNPLDNRSLNLRECTPQQNQMNSNKHKINKSSKYKGVHYSKSKGKWVSKIMYNYKETYVGIFNTEIEAAKAYNEKALIIFGEFASINKLC